MTVLVTSLRQVFRTLCGDNQDGGVSDGGVSDWGANSEPCHRHAPTSLLGHSGPLELVLSLEYASHHHPFACMR